MSANDIEMVQEKLIELQRTLEQERERHETQRKADQERIDALESKLKKPTASRVTTTKTTTTTTTSKVASNKPGGSNGSTPRDGASVTVRQTRASALAAQQRGRPNSSRSNISDSGSTAAAADKKAAALAAGPRKPVPASSERQRSASPNPTAMVEGGFTATALQHSWDKFCVKARNEFTVKELSLLSCETLKLLMEYYNFRDPVEVAQVEAQWALLQEGRDTAYQATPHDGRPRSRSRGFQPVKHPQEFNIDINAARKPHLSNRRSLSNDRMGGSDPNTACERHRSVSPGGKGTCHTDPAAASNPNWKMPNRYAAKPTGKRSFPVLKESRFEEKSFPRGKSRAFSPEPGAVSAHPIETKPDPYHGVRKFSVKTTPEHQDRGVRIGYNFAEKDDRPRMKRQTYLSNRSNIISLA